MATASSPSPAPPAAPSAHPAAPTSKAARTRAAILAAAEQRFAEQGFDRTRLEDVASAVGIRRASIVYHFRDKAALYAEVLRQLFRDLETDLRRALEAPAPPLERVAAAVGAWVAYVGRRPSIAHILLREVADATRERRAALHEHSAPILAMVEAFLAEWKALDMPRLDAVDPSHVASVITGATVFFFAAMPSLLWERGFDPLATERVERHRREILDITWHMLGIDRPSASPGDGEPR